MVTSAVWTAISASVRGATHKRNGLPNQDAVRLKNPFGSREVLLMAIADGHGSTRSFRSDRGSALAAECALREMGRFIQRVGPDAPLSRVRHQARARWPKNLIAAWKKAVRDDVATFPFSPLDFAAFPEPPPVIKPGEEWPASAYLVYGATLLTVAITRTYILYSQLGDGDILTVNSEGRVARPLPKQHEFQANQTISLCSGYADREFQIKVASLRGGMPAMIMMSTDGYANCFGDDEGFYRVGADFLSYLREHGTGFVGEKLEEWLHESSQDGSGDDITVGLAVRAQTLPLHAPKTKPQLISS